MVSLSAKIKSGLISHFEIRFNDRNSKLNEKTPKVMGVARNSKELSHDSFLNVPSFSRLRQQAGFYFIQM